jgi:hypothetical protein
MTATVQRSRPTREPFSAKRKRPPAHDNLDNLTLSRKEGWRDFVEAPCRIQPERLTRRQIRHLSDAALDTYNQRRNEWHANIGPLQTPQLLELRDDLWNVLNSNAKKDGNKTKAALAIDGNPCVGKTTATEDWAKKFHHREIQRHGEYTRAGDERWPVCRVGMRGNTSMKTFNRALCEFYAHPGADKGNVDQLGRWALDCVLSCETQVLIIDDIHFLHWQHKGGVEISHHFKYIADEFPLTLISIGVGLGERGVLLEGGSYDDAVLNQTTRWTTTLEMRPFAIATERGRRDWHELLKTLEDRVVLSQKYQGMLADDLSDYLFIRSTGYIGSLMELLTRGCEKAMRRGTEVLTETLFDTVKIDSAAERARRELQVAFRTRRMTTRVQQQ